MLGFGLGLEQITEMLSRLESKSVSIRAEQCSRVRHRRATCTRCAQVCPTQAITWDDHLTVDTERCSGCGLCATVCPTGAIQSRSPNNVELIAQIEAAVKDRGHVVLACPTYLDARGWTSPGLVRVNCLGRVDASLLMDAIASGARPVYLVDGACATCARATGRQIAGKSVETVSALLPAWEIAPCIAFVPELPDRVKSARTQSGEDPVSRRAFFDLFRQRTAEVTRVAVASVLEGTKEPPPPIKGSLPVRSSTNRELLLNALRRLGPPKSEADAGELSAWFGFKESCTGCRVCAFFCPTGALTKIDKDGQIGLEFKAGLCTNCGLCVELCPTGDAMLSPRVPLNKILAGTSEQMWIMSEEEFRKRMSPEYKLRRIFDTSAANTPASGDKV